LPGVCSLVIFVCVIVAQVFTGGSA